ncbi:MAG: trigger factor [Pyrinomonadaceae bacterium]|nr:trigger factor [Pyrinomonadaceae bacterium]
MKAQVKEVSSTQKELTVEIDAQTVKAAYNKVSQKYAKAANVPGFRKGFAPLDVVRMRFKEEIRNEVLQEIVPNAVTAAIEENDLHPLTEPHLHLENPDTVKLNGTEAVSIHVHVEVMPEIPTPEYKGLELTRRVRPVEDSQLEDLLANRLNEQAALIPVEDRPSQEGDTVIVDLEGTFEGEPDAEPIIANDIEIPIGDETIEKSFSENLVGLSEDEEKIFTVAYEANFSSPQLAGKTVNYKAKVKSVGTMETPEMNDEWAQSLDEGYESLEDLRKKMRKDLQKFAEEDADARLRNNAIAKFIEKHPFEIPNVLIDSQAKNLLNNFAQDMAQRGVDLNTVQKEFIEMAYSQMRTQAERDVRGAMLLEKVADLENVEVSDAEVEEEIQKMANYYRVTPDEVRNSLINQQGGTDNVKNNLRTRKAIEALVSHAKVTEGEWVDESVGQIADSQSEEAAAPEEKVEKKPAKKKAKSDDEAEAKPKKSAAKKSDDKENKKKAAKEE